MIEYNEQFFEGRQASATDSARAVVPVVVSLLEPKSVVDVGCAMGEWLLVFRDAGVEDFLGIDGDYVRRERLVIPADRFVERNLSQGVELDRTFDLAVSLEVAEHLPESSAETFVASLVRLSRVVLFSAAIPHQGGTGHLNEQWPSYWAERFAAHGYVPIDALRPRLWNLAPVRRWYRQNTLLFIHPDELASRPELEAERERTDADRLDVVHPLTYLKKANPSTRRLVRTLRQRVRRRLFGR